MIIKNFLDSPGVDRIIHNGKSTAKSVKLFGEEDFETNLKYISFTSIPPGSSIGIHDHKNECEEVYTILEGSGLFTLNASQRRVNKGDVILSKPGCSHGLENDTSKPLEVFIFWVKK
jgi:mannose-6-phosphate isomerase-like protein (cupin superfamily)